MSYTTLPMWVHKAMNRTMYTNFPEAAARSPCSMRRTTISPPTMEPTRSSSQAAPPGVFGPWEPVPFDLRRADIFVLYSNLVYVGGAVPFASF